MLNIVRAGICVCVTPRELVAADVEAGILRVLQPEPPLRPLTFFVATRAESIDPAVADIAQIVVEVTRLSRPIEEISGPSAGPRTTVDDVE
jgi:DNA-binding transcriptional LysR family regulator